MVTIPQGPRDPFNASREQANLQRGAQETAASVGGGIAEGGIAVGQDGIKRYRTEIVAENMIMLDSKGGGGGSFQGQNQGQAQGQAPAASEPVINIDEEPKEDEIQVENIPF